MSPGAPRRWVVHDRAGRILALGTPAAEPWQGLAVGCRPVAARGQRAVELDVDAEQAELSPLELAARFRVRVDRRGVARLAPAIEKRAAVKARSGRRRARRP